jgi:hypothetical protein
MHFITQNPLQIIGAYFDANPVSFTRVAGSLGTEALLISHEKTRGTVLGCGHNRHYGRMAYY